MSCSPDITLRAVVCDGLLAGSIASFPSGGQTEVTYWIDRPGWGKGIATQALALLLKLVPDRPLYARAASGNADSLRVVLSRGGTLAAIADVTRNPAHHVRGLFLP